MIARQTRKLSASLGVSFLLCAGLIAQADKSQEVQLHYEKAEAALREGQLEKAGKEFREVLHINPTIAEAHANLGVIAYKLSNFSEAQRCFSEAVKLNPSLWEAQAFLGLSELKLGHNAEAKSLLEKTFPKIRNRDLRSEVGVDLVGLYQQSRTLDRAVDVLRDITQSNPDDPAMLYLSYRIYTDLAAQSVAKLSQAAPESAQLHQILAQAAASQDDMQGAITEYKKALEINAHLAGIHYELGRVLLASSQAETVRQEAQHEFETELAANPADANSEYELGQVYSMESNWPLATEHYSRALKIDPDLADAHIGLAKVLKDRGQAAEALAHLIEAERLDPDNETAHYRLAQVYRESGQNIEAERELALFKRRRDSRIPTRAVSRKSSPEQSEPDKF